MKNNHNNHVFNENIAKFVIMLNVFDVKVKTFSIIVIIVIICTCTHKRNVSFFKIDKCSIVCCETLSW